MRSDEDAPPTPADLRAKIAFHDVLLYRVAARAGFHPATLGAFLHEHRPMSREIAERCLRAIEDEASGG